MTLISVNTDELDNLMEDNVTKIGALQVSNEMLYNRLSTLENTISIAQKREDLLINRLKIAEDKIAEIERDRLQHERSLFQKILDVLPLKNEHKRLKETVIKL